MKKHRKLLMLLVLSVIFVCLFATPAFAITESEVQTQVDICTSAATRSYRRTMKTSLP